MAEEARAYSSRGRLLSLVEFEVKGRNNATNVMLVKSPLHWHCVTFLLWKASAVEATQVKRPVQWRLHKPKNVTLRVGSTLVAIQHFIS